jgi:hypothetical protein
MAHFRLQQMAFYLGGGWPPPHGQIIGCRVEISLDPHERKPVQLIFLGGGYFFCILILEEFPEVSHGSLALSLSLSYGTWNRWVRGKV